MRDQWRDEVEAPAERAGVPCPKLKIVQSPYRSFLDPLLKQIDEFKEQFPERKIAVVVPEVVETKWWEWLLHRRKPARLRSALIKRGDKRVVVVSVPWYIED
jgi:hypothetical protein